MASFVILFYFYFQDSVRDRSDSWLTFCSGWLLTELSTAPHVVCKLHAKDPCHAVRSAGHELKKK
jgi:hypothetical protein